MGPSRYVFLLANTFTGNYDRYHNELSAEVTLHTLIMLSEYELLPLDYYSLCLIASIRMTRGPADIHSIPQKSETNHTRMQTKQAIDSRESRHGPART